MSREKIYTMLHKLRACVIRKKFIGCGGNCQECMYAINDEELVKMCDQLIFMYRPVKEKKKFMLFRKKVKK